MPSEPQKVSQVLLERKCHFLQSIRGAVLIFDELTLDMHRPWPWPCVSWSGSVSKLRLAYSNRLCCANLQLSRTIKTIVNLHSMTCCYMLSFATDLDTFRTWLSWSIFTMSTSNIIIIHHIFTTIYPYRLSLNGSISVFYTLKTPSKRDFRFGTSEKVFDETHC